MTSSPRVLTVLLGATVLLTGPRTAAQGASEEAVLRRHFERFAEAFAKGDAKAIAASYAEDADVLRGNGPRVQGRSEIQAFYEKQFAGPMKDTQKSMAVVWIRFLKPDVAVVDGTYEIRGPAPAGGVPAPPIRGAFTTVLVKTGSEWLGVVSRSHRLAG